MTSAAYEPGYVIVGRYRVIRRLGAGGMGVVYEAEQLELGRSVAVKVLHPDATKDASMTARFLREARAAAQIGHPGIVQVFDLGTDGAAPFLVMEKLEGEELGGFIERGNPLPVEWVVSMGIELCDALQAAHDHGIVHRDLKPPNVFLAKQGRRTDVVKVLDFGIAKLLQRVDEVETKTGQVFGTPSYMAPEQLRDSKDVDGRADVYAIGCILFQALVGHPPFEAATYPDLIFRICSAPRPRAHDLRGDVPRALGELIARALALEPAERPASPAEFALALGARPASSPVVVNPSSAPARPSSGRTPAGGSASLVEAPTEAAHVVGITPKPQDTAPSSGKRQRNALIAAAVALSAIGLGAVASSGSGTNAEMDPTPGAASLPSLAVTTATPAVTTPTPAVPSPPITEQSANTPANLASLGNAPAKIASSAAAPSSSAVALASPQTLPSTPRAATSAAKRPRSTPSPVASAATKPPPLIAP